MREEVFPKTRPRSPYHSRIQDIDKKAKQQQQQRQQNQVQDKFDIQKFVFKDQIDIPDLPNDLLSNGPDDFGIPS